MSLEEPKLKIVEKYSDGARFVVATNYKGFYYVLQPGEPMSVARDACLEFVKACIEMGYGDQFKKRRGP